MPFPALAIALVAAQRPPSPQTLGLEQGTRYIDTADFRLRLGRASGVALGLSPKSSRDFDFLPSDRLGSRSTDGFVHLGDISFRVREGGAWKEYRSYGKRAPVKPLPAVAPVLAADDLAGTLGAGCPVRVVRRWAMVNGRLGLLFDVSNPGAQPVEIGALGIPMPFNNIIMDRSLEEAHARCSFTDPYIGGDAGFLRVSRLDGVGANMVVTPVGKTPLEAWHLVNEPLRPNQVFEGMMEWTVHTKAFAETEWKGVEGWVPPSSVTLRPGETRTYGVRFSPSPSIRAIEDTVAKAGNPVAIGIPGYVLPKDLTGKLFLKYGKGVREMAVEPKGALEWTPNREGRNGWRGYNIHAKGWGRARLTVTYADGTRQVVSYYGIKPAAEAVGDLGRFLTTKAWFTDKNDPFGRAPSAISYDREIDAPVLQDSRVWIAGLGDEAGSGNWLSLAMKEFGQPEPGEVAKLESFIHGVLWGNLQFKDGPNKYGVRKSVFFYDPKVLPDFPYDKNRNWTSWTSWSKAHTDDIGRGYNYPHVVAAYWSMYRIARNYPTMGSVQPWDWYLNQAYHTTEFLTSVDANGNDRVGYMRLGMMEGSIFMALLDDLRREGWKEKADLIEARMRERADRWKGEPFPFGSEMAWDSTGQEEVYGWCKRFGFEDKAQVTLNSILAYDPTVPHWGYNGNARRYWDFLYGGKLSRIERQIHHYGSGMNAIPLLTEFRQNPHDLYLLRVGYGGTMGAISNIDQEGFASAAFHSFPSTLKWDAYSGDYGPNFVGHTLNAATYLVDTKDFGWQSFGGNLRIFGDTILVEPKDSYRKRFFVAPAGLLLTLDAGTFDSVVYNLKTRAVTVNTSLGSRAPVGRLVVQTTTRDGVPYRPDRELTSNAGAYLVPNGTTLTLSPAK